ncbi:helix-turn-helix domain-containing protein [Erwinia sp. OPT-41]|uniref:Helix-turn-helix domain-containing protein n=1 Tax=Erwinia plantamica TaxID=3237104 RepID=A0ABW7CLQ6_9GAMM
MTKHDVASRKIKQLLFEKGWNRSELARKLGVSAQTVHQWDKGITRPNGANLTKLAEVSGKAESWFFQADNDDSPVSPSKPMLMKDDEFSELTEEEKRLIRVYRLLADYDGNNMLLAFEMRYKELKAYEKYTKPPSIK